MACLMDCAVELAGFEPPDGLGRTDGWGDEALLERIAASSPDDWLAGAQPSGASSASGGRSCSSAAWTFSMRCLQIW